MIQERTALIGILRILGPEQNHLEINHLEICLIIMLIAMFLKCHKAASVFEMD